MKKLEWDSDFWGIPYYQLDSLDEIASIDENRAFYQIILDDLEIKNSNLLSTFTFLEAKIEMSKVISIENSFCDKLDKIKLEDVELNSNVFFQMFGTISRFRMFDQEKVNEFYNTWLTNSILGKFDSNAIGYYKNNKLAGFATYRIHNDELHVGLLGVFPEYQKMGISQKIMLGLEYEASKNSVSMVRISTNTLNIAALNAYMKSGFKIDSVRYWFYVKK